MAGLATTGSNPDVSLLYDINNLAQDAPGWLDRTVAFLGSYGLPLGMAALVVACWWTERRRAGSLDGAAASAAAVLWAPLAAVVAILVNVPIRGFVQRPRPFADHDGLDVLVHGEHGFSFVSDHATLVMAAAAGLFVANRRFGLIGIALAGAEGFCRVFAGVHYPTDVIGGFALGTAVALLLSPLAGLTLTPLTKAVAGSRRFGWLVGPAGLTGRRGDRGLRLRNGTGQPAVGTGTGTSGRADGAPDRRRPAPAQRNSREQQPRDQEHRHEASQDQRHRHEDPHDQGHRDPGPQGQGPHDPGPPGQDSHGQGHGHDQGHGHGHGQGPQEPDLAA